jgi:multicomponent Na+:H+ antiporter subunit G
VIETLRDLVSAALLLLGGFVSLVAAIGLHRLGDVRSRMHAATKPASLGVAACASGAILQVSAIGAASILVVVILLQVLTTPVGAHLFARAITRVEERRGETPTD